MPDDLTPEEREGQRDYIDATRNSSHGPIRGSEALLEGDDTTPPPSAREVYEQLRWETDDGRPTWEEIAEADALRMDYKTAQATTWAATADTDAKDPLRDMNNNAMWAMTTAERDAARNADPTYTAAEDALYAAWDGEGHAADALTAHAGRAMGADRGQVDEYANNYWPGPVARDVRDAAWNATGGAYLELGDYWGSNRRETLSERLGLDGPDWTTESEPAPAGAGRPAAERGA